MQWDVLSFLVFTCVAKRFCCFCVNCYGRHQAPRLSEELGAAHLSTGDMLRDAVNRKTPVGLQAQACMSEGKLVADEIVVGIINDRIGAKDCRDGFILDGFPRTVPQTLALDTMLAKNNEKVTAVRHVRLD